MKTNLTMQDVTQDVKSSVNAYLMARAYAETMRSAIDKIQRGVLEECPLTNGLEVKHGKSERRITDPEHAYLETREDHIQDYYAECDKREREAGLKPKEMEFDYCPALVAEHLQVKSEWLLIESAAEMLGEDKPEDFNNKLLCHGLESRKKFIDLVVGLVLNLPDFENPMN